MDGFKTNYNISDIIRMLRYEIEPWAVEFDEMSSNDRIECVKKRWEQNKASLDGKIFAFKNTPMIVGDM